MSLDEVLKSLNQEFLEKVALKLSKTGIQKTLAQEKIAVNASHLKEKLEDRLDFRRRLEGLSENAMEIFHYVFISGYSLEVPLTGANKFAPETEECIENLVLFPISGGRNSTMLVMPLEYAIYSLETDNLGHLSLLNALITTYTFGQLTSIGRKIGIKRNVDKISMAMDICREVLNGASRELKQLNEAEKRLFQFVADNSGVVAWDVIEDKFQSKIHSTYYGPDAGTLIGTSIPSGDPLKSLLLKGLLIPELAYRYNEVKAIAIPEEIYVSFLRDKLQSIKNAHGNRDAAVKYPSIKMPETRLFENLKAVMAIIYFLQTRNKRVNVDIIAKYLSSTTETDILYALAIAYRFDLIAGSGTKISLAENALKDLDRVDFYEKILKEIIESFIIPSTVAPNNIQDNIGILARGIMRNYLYNMMEPTSVGNLIENISSSESFMMSIRHLKALSLTRRDFDSTQKSGDKKTPVSLEDSVKSVIKSHLALLSNLGYLLVSSTPLDLDTSVLPDKELLKIMERPSEIGKIRVRLKGPDDIKVLPDYEILVDIGTKFSILAKIIRFADLEKIDRICVLRLTSKSIMGALNDGISGNEIIQLLQDKSSTGLPENVRQTVLDLSGKSHVVNIVMCSAILKVDDPLTLDRIYSDTYISQMVGERVDRNIATLKEDISLSRLVTEMRKKGFIVPFALEEARKMEKRRKYGRGWGW